MLKVQEGASVQGMIAFGFPSHWFMKWHEIFKPITKCSNNCNHVITFNSHLKTALFRLHAIGCMTLL